MPGQNPTHSRAGWQSVLAPSRLPRSLWPLVAALLLVWGMAARAEHLQRFSFFDDAFIYLAVARNVVETGSAHTFPVTDNPGLIASSPLRLLTLVPSYCMARIAHAPPSREQASLAFLLSAVLTSLVFLPFFWRDIRAWLYAATMLGLLAMTTNATLQMEAAPLFWSVLCLIRGLRAKASNLEVGALLALLTLARVEYGLAATVVLIAVGPPTPGRRWPALAQWLAVMLAAAAAWSLVATLLGVWPIPTTWLSKIVSGELRQFSPPFLRTLATTLGNYVPLPEAKYWQRVLVAVFALVTAATLWRATCAGRALFGLLGLTLAVLATGPGNFAWYHENLLIALVAGLAALSLPHVRAPAVAGFGHRALLALLLSLMAAERLGSNDRLPWSLRDSRTYGHSLVTLSQRHLGGGVFMVPECAPFGFDRAYIEAAEIGILAYCSGAEVWLYDSSGLAQAGQLDGVREKWLSHCYPERALVTAAAELAALRARATAALPGCRLHYGPGAPTGSVALGDTDLWLEPVR